jgi:hypothetical protein
MTNQITRSMPPRPVGRFVDAVNRSDPEEAIAVFAADALVNDIRREFSGTTPIRAWFEREIIGDAVRLETLETRAHYQTTIVTARTTGTFDKANLPDPLDLTYYFTTTPDTITQLMVIANQPTPDWAISQQVPS